LTLCLHGCMDQNPLYHALQTEQARRSGAGLPPVLSLIDSNFHANGFIPPRQPFDLAFSDYLTTRTYAPDSKGLREAREAVYRFFCNGGPVSPGIGADLSRNCGLNPDHILLTASSSAAYSLLFGCFAQAGDNVLLPLPAYPLFEDLCSYADLEPRFYPLDPKRGWQPDTDVLEVLCDEHTRFVVLISPNNPTGSVMNEAAIINIAEICRQNHTAIISDEVFSEFLYTSHELPRAMALCPDVPVYTLNGISKLFASPDLKLGWIAITGPDAEERTSILEMREDTYLNTNSFSQFLLPRLFASLAMQEFVRLMRDRCALNRDVFARVFKLDKNNSSLPAAGIHLVLPLVRSRFPDDEKAAIHLLQKTGLYVHPGYLYGLDDHPSFVLSILKEVTAFASGIETLHSFLRSP